MRRIAALFAGVLLFASSSRAETPCDFKGISVGDRMTPAEIMAALGVAKYKMSPKKPLFEDKLAAAKKYGLIPAGEMEDWEIGPYCEETFCRVPYGVTVGNNNDIPVSVHIAFGHAGLITEIDVSFSETDWDEMLPIWNQKYGADWTADREVMPVTDYETKKTTVLERISLDHISNGTNQSTKDRCEIWATNLDIVFEHHDPLGPYHSVFAINLISKNF